jgi:hypothetical protein
VPLSTFDASFVPNRLASARAVSSFDVEAIALSLDVGMLDGTLTAVLEDAGAKATSSSM